MATGGQIPGWVPERGEPVPLGQPMSVEQHLLDKGAAMLQALKPMKHFSQHVCTFAMYGHDLTRQIETCHYVTRINEDFLQCAVYDSDESHGHLIGVEYITTDRIFETLAPDEQKLWHSHAYEIKTGLWMTPRIPEMVIKPELEKLAKTYGKFWCTWQTDRGDRLPMGPPALMFSPQAGVMRPDLVGRRDRKYDVDSGSLKASRVEIPEPEWINPQADYWKSHGKGFVIVVEPTEMKTEPFP